MAPGVLPAKPVQQKRPPLNRTHSVIGSRIQRQPQTIHQSILRHLHDQRIANGRSRTRYLFGLNSASPWSLDRHSSLKFGKADLVENGRVVNPKEAKRRNPPSGDMAILAIPPAAFNVVAQLAEDTKKLFPDENQHYWAHLENLKNNINSLYHRHNGDDFLDDFKYYQHHHYLIQSTGKALAKTVNGFAAIRKQMSAGVRVDAVNMALSLKVAGICRYMPYLHSLRRILTEKWDARRRHDLSVKLLISGRKRFAEYDEPQQPPLPDQDILPILSLIIGGVNSFITTLQSLRVSLNQPVVVYPLRILDVEALNGGTTIEDIQIASNLRESQNILETMEAYINFDADNRKFESTRDKSIADRTLELPPAERNSDAKSEDSRFMMEFKQGVEIVDSMDQPIEDVVV
ncbi:hypothetical protein AA313_de0200890 [Arthrobotrys entomopaga]|nr:hypothetical protein AA313_de0200890 [Arthrobotrys entomopaga]